MHGAVTQTQLCLERACGALFWQSAGLHTFSYRLKLSYNAFRGKSMFSHNQRPLATVSAALSRTPESEYGATAALPHCCAGLPSDSEASKPSDSTFKYYC